MDPAPLQHSAERAPSLGRAVLRNETAQAPPLRADDLAPLTELAGYLALFAVALLMGLVLTSAACASSLKTHERMAALVRGALRACKEDGQACAAVLPCARAARQAGEAIQAARRADADGTTDAETTARALALPRAAEDACRRAGIRPEKSP